jgi:hypothetical protein
MGQKTLTHAVTNIVQELEEFASEDRHRIIQASMTLLGEGPTRVAPDEEKIVAGQGGPEEFPAKARIWLKHNALTAEQINQVFHFGEEGPEILVSIPGANKKEQVRNAYVLCGIGEFLASGETKFEDESAREICESGGFFDGTNHMKYMKGSEFAGSRAKGWVLTAPGLKLAASLIMQLSKDGRD